VAKLVKFTKKNISKITSGYYWLANDAFDTTGKDIKDIVLHRPVQIIVVEEAYTRQVSGFRDGIWMMPGVYIIFVGSPDWHRIDYVLGWGNVSLTPAKPPKGF
jgi:hypothetical protein